jgi:rRNA maturation endonuclease Nob1
MSRIDYKVNNYCTTCVLKFPKDVNQCDDCGERLRTTPHNKIKHQRVYH